MATIHQRIFPRVARPRLQHGSMLLGAVITLLIASVLLIGTVRSNLERASTQAGAATGQAVYDINKALGSFITSTSNSAAIQTGGSIPGVANPLAPTVQELQALGLLNAQMNPTPLNGGAYQTQIVLQPLGCVSTACNIASRVWMTNPVLDVFSSKPDIKRISGLLGAVGGNGGFSDPLNPAIIRGSAGWTLANPDPMQRAGIVLAVNGYGSTIDSNYVRMRDTRDPDLQGNLTVAGDVISKGYLGLGGANVTLGAVCSADASGFLGKTSAGTVLICNGVTWQNVSGFDQVVTAGTACTAGQVGRDTNGVLMSCQGGVYKDAAGFPNDVVAGTVCASSGLFGMDSGGRSYLCRGGYWITQANLSPFAVEMARYIVTDGSATISKPTCAAGGAQTYDMTPMSVSLDLTVAPPYSALEYVATDLGAGWLPRITLRAPNGATQSGNNLNISALMRVYCTYPV